MRFFLLTGVLYLSILTDARAQYTYRSARSLGYNLSPGTSDYSVGRGMAFSGRASLGKKQEPTRPSNIGPDEWKGFTHFDPKMELSYAVVLDVKTTRIDDRGILPLGSSVIEEIVDDDAAYIRVYGEGEPKPGSDGELVRVENFDFSRSADGDHFAPVMLHVTRQHNYLTCNGEQHQVFVLEALDGPNYPQATRHDRRLWSLGSPTSEFFATYYAWESSAGRVHLMLPNRQLVAVLQKDLNQQSQDHVQSLIKYFNKMAEYENSPRKGR